MATFDDMLSEIIALPIVDTYTRVRPDSPRGDLAQLAMCEEIKAELASANVPAEFFQIDGAKKMLAESLQYMPRIMNTSTYRRLTQILTDLLGSPTPLHEADIEALWSKCESAGDAEAILAKGNIEKVLVSYAWHRHAPKADGRFAPVMDIGSLINEAHTSRTLDRLGEVTDQKVYEVEDMRKAIVQLFRQAKEAGVVAASVALEPQTDFESGERSAADRIISLVLLGQKVNREDRKAFRSHVMDLVLANCREHRMPIQLRLGRRYVRSAEREITGYDPYMASMYADMFTRHPGTKFDVILGSDALVHEFAVISRQFRNVFLDGVDTFLATPTRLHGLLRERIELLPMTKCCALASGSECVEWVYANALLIRRELAFTLSQLIDDGCLSHDTAVEVARQYLVENPKRIYKIE